MAQCSTCSTEIGNGGIVQENGAVLCVTCDDHVHRPVMRFKARQLKVIHTPHDSQQLISPRFTPWATYWIAFANAMVFFVMCVMLGTNAFSPPVDFLKTFGGNNGPLTLYEPWRLISCQFVHAGPVHFISNMYVLILLGTLAENLLGRRRFVLLYVLSGLGGAMLTLWWNPAIVSVGASGAIFGIAGALLAWFAQNHDGSKAEAIRKQTNAVLVFAACNLFLGFTTPGIDNAGHIGGIATGFLLGLLVSAPPSAIWRELAALGLAACVFGAGYERLEWRLDHSRELAAQKAARTFVDYFKKIKELAIAQDKILKELSRQYLKADAFLAREPLVDEARANLLALQNIQVGTDERIVELHASVLKTGETALELAQALANASDAAMLREVQMPYTKCSDAAKEMSQKFKEFEERFSHSR